MSLTFTGTLVEIAVPGMLAVMIVSPGPTAVMLPFSSTVATFGSDDV